MHRSKTTGPDGKRRGSNDSASSAGSSASSRYGPLQFARTRLPREIPIPLGQDPPKPPGPRPWEPWPWLDYTSVIAVERRGSSEGSSDEEQGEAEDGAGTEQVTLPPMTREAMLEIVFEEFDGDRSGSVDATELMSVGKARREGGHKDVPWTEKKTQDLLEKMDRDNDGKVSKSEFVAHFSAALPAERDEFDKIMREFLFTAAYVKRPVDRITSLNNVFLEFDYDRDGVFSANELLSLSKQGVMVVGAEVNWMPEMTAKLLQEMDKDDDGQVTQREFSSYMDAHLPKDKAVFDAIIQKFLTCARSQMASARGRLLDRQHLLVAAKRDTKRRMFPPQGTGNQECPEDATRLGRNGCLLDRPRALPWPQEPGLSCGLGSKSWLDMVTEFYLRHQPAKASNAGPILESYKGREAALVAKLYAKYAQEPEESERMVNGVLFELRKPNEFVALDLGASSPTKADVGARKGWTQAGADGGGLFLDERRICLGTGNDTSCTLATLARSGKGTLKQPGLPDSALAVVVACFEECLSRAQHLVPVCSSLVSLWDVQGTAAFCGPSSALANLASLASHALRSHGYKLLHVVHEEERLPHIVVYFPKHAGAGPGIPMGWKSMPLVQAPVAAREQEPPPDENSSPLHQPTAPSKLQPHLISAAAAPSNSSSGASDTANATKTDDNDEGNTRTNTEGFTVGLANLRNPLWCVQSPRGGGRAAPVSTAATISLSCENSYEDNFSASGWVVGAKSLKSSSGVRDDESTIDLSSALADMDDARATLEYASLHTRSPPPTMDTAVSVYEMDKMRAQIEALLHWEQGLPFPPPHQSVGQCNVPPLTTELLLPLPGGGDPMHAWDRLRWQSMLAQHLPPHLG